jgi:transcriptional regulator with XRE-family HTH domain
MNDHINNPAWGQNLRKLVAETGLSQRAFAIKHGFTSRTFNYWCNGRWPGEQTAREVAKALTVDYAQLVSERPLGLNGETLETAINVVDLRLREFGDIKATARSKLYSLAYQHLQNYQSPQALDRHVMDLLALQNQLRP